MSDTHGSPHLGGHDLYERLEQAAGALAELTGRGNHDVVAVLGSGLGGYPGRLEGAVLVSYNDLPGFPLPTAEGHAGTAYSARIGANRVLLMSGRIHAYEGRSADEIVFAVRAAITAGCRKVVLTNASGGCGDGLEAGDLVLITDHVSLTGLSPLTGPNDERIGPRFPDMTEVYSPTLRARAHAAATRAGVNLKEGVYFWFRGPMYETPAEIRMVRALGGSLVGMSTVPEAIAARHMGAEVLGVSLCTNLAAGLSATPLTHEEVIEVGNEASARFADLFDHLLPSL